MKTHTPLHSSGSSSAQSGAAGPINDILAQEQREEERIATEKAFIADSERAEIQRLEQERKNLEEREAEAVSRELQAFNDEELPRILAAGEQAARKECDAIEAHARKRIPAVTEELVATMLTDEFLSSL